MLNMNSADMVYFSINFVDNYTSNICVAKRAKPWKYEQKKSVDKRNERVSKDDSYLFS